MKKYDFQFFLFFLDSIEKIRDKKEDERKKKEKERKLI